MGTEELNRLRWQCRRGLLEPDLLPERFAQRRRDRPRGERLSSFKTLWDHADNDLPDLIRARRMHRFATRRSFGMDT